jgi:hypothetical protein
MLWNNQVKRASAYITLALFLASGSACWAQNQKADAAYVYHIVDLSPVKLNVELMGLTDCTSMLALSTTRVLAACRSAKSDKGDDYGLRVFLLGTDAQKVTILSATQGLGDAYSVKLQQRTNASAKYQNIILADAAAEYAYGAAVYQLDGDKLKYLGQIAHVQMNSETNPISALAITKIQPTENGFKVSFDKNVYLLNKNGEYKRVPAAKAGMSYDGKVLK